MKMKLSFMTNNIAIWAKWQLQSGKICLPITHPIGGWYLKYIKNFKTGTLKKNNPIKNGIQISKQFWKDETHIVDKRLSKCSISLPISKMQIKTTSRFLPKSERPRSVKHGSCKQMCRGSRTFSLLVEFEHLQSLWESDWQILRKLGFDLPQDLAVLFTLGDIGFTFVSHWPKQLLK